MTLAEMQQRFAKALLHGDDAAIVEAIDDRGLPPAALVALYRGSIFASLKAVLEANAPDLDLAQDEQRFQAAAQAFIRDNPPTSPCLAEYGQGFAEWLEAKDAP